MGRSARLCAASLAILALAGATAGRAAEPAKLRVAFATTFSTNCIPYLAAKDFGWFKAEGVAPEELMLNSDANATRALVTGSADVAMTGPLNLYSAIENGAQVKWIGSWQIIVDYDVVAGPAIKSLKDLADKTFASSGPSGLPQDLPLMLFKKLGIPTDHVRFVAIGSHPARLQAVVAGKADAALVNEITAQVGIKSGAVHIVAQVPDYFPKLGYVALAVNDAALADPAKRQALIGFMAASIRGARFAAAEPAKAAEVLHNHLKDLDAALITKVVERLDAQKVWAVQGGIDPEVVNFTARTEYELGQLKSPIDDKQVVDPSIVAAALQRLGK